MIEYQEQHKLMGCQFTLGVVAPDHQQAKSWIALGVQEIRRIEALLSEFQEGSEISKINQASARTPVAVSEETYSLLRRSEGLSRLTKGDFDISVGPLKGLYQFKNKDFCPPSDSDRLKALKAVGWNKLNLNRPGQITKNQKNMRLSLASIGKGYAADKVKHLWKELGVPGGFVNSSGDLSAFGARPSKEPWKIGISHPDQPEQLLLHLPLNNQALATSGDYHQHFMHQGKRYSHTLNPKTGKPTTGLKSVSVIAPSAELADALATALFVKGVKNGLALVNQLPQTHALFIDDNNNLHFSKHLHYEVIEAVA